jgi:hypothetical protein
MLPAVNHSSVFGAPEGRNHQLGATKQRRMD